jgi:hypothetical protein
METLSLFDVANPTTFDREPGAKTLACDYPECPRQPMTWSVGYAVRLCSKHAGDIEAAKVAAEGKRR